MKIPFPVTLYGFITTALGLFVSAANADEYEAVEIETIPVTKNIAMLVGRGGNIGVLSGEEGIFLIDDQFAPLTEKILAAISAIDEGPIRFVLNTHWHFDHTGGNENLGRAGAVIVAHENVRKRMAVDNFNEFWNRTIPASPKEALPMVTFTENVSFHLNGEELHVTHFKNAHTDGDAVIFFKKANVVHMGDLYFNTGGYPYIDIWAGGSIDGVLAALGKILGKIDDETHLIPGHGTLGNKGELTQYSEKLTSIRTRVQALIDQGMSLDEVVAAKPTADYDTEAALKGFIPPDKFVTILYKDLAGKP